MAKKKAKAKKPATQPANPAPRQKALPGMQDRRVAALERAALEYADVRDERMRWTKSEVETKKRVQDLMHEQKRTHYQHGNIEITLEPEGEKVRVRVSSRDEVVDGNFPDPEVDEPPSEPAHEEPAEPGDEEESEDEEIAAEVEP